MINTTLWVLRIMDPNTPWQNPVASTQLRPYSTLPCSSSWCSGGGKKKLPVVFFLGTARWSYPTEVWWILTDFPQNLMDFGWYWYFIDFFLQTFESPFFSPNTKHAKPRQNHDVVQPVHAGYNQSTTPCRGLYHPCRGNPNKSIPTCEVKRRPRGLCVHFYIPWKWSWNLNTSLMFEKGKFVWSIQLHF